MLSDGVQCYGYNEANQLSQVKTCSNNQLTAAYTYDYNGNRIVKKLYTNGVLSATVYSPSDSYETKKIVAGNSTQNTSYYYANDQLIAKKNPDGTKVYYQNDQLGSASLITNQSGALVEQTTYDPWGVVRQGGTASKFQYTGQEKDQESGLNYYNARYYNPNVRRFTQADTIIPDLYNPQTLNRYSYVTNNPLRYTDPSGHGPEALGACVLGPVGCGVALASIAVTAVLIAPIIPTLSGQNTSIAGMATKSIITSSAITMQLGMNNWQKFWGQVNNFFGINNQNPQNNQAQTPTLRGSNNPVVRNAIQIGQQAHNEYKPVLESRGYDTSFRFKNGLRTDGINFNSHDIVEYKPDTPTGRAQGVRQLPGYINQANEELPLDSGESWTGHIEYYNPSDIIKP